MSTNESSPCHDEMPTDCPVIAHIINGESKDIGGFSVKRSLPFAKQRMVGPWIFFDHMGPASFPVGQGLDVRPHPHIGLATVTYLFHGEIIHRDSLGSHQAIRPGDVNLMIAGRGITHSERSPQNHRENGHVIEGLQLWMALPQSHQEMAPQFHHYNKNDLPYVELDGCSIQVMLGAAFGVISPIVTHSPCFFAQAECSQGADLQVPMLSEQAIYVVEGNVAINSTTVPNQHLIILTSNSTPILHMLEDSKIILLGGSPLGKRHIWWNFVSTDKARIDAAKQQWKNGQFPAIAEDGDEFIPLPNTK
ncbi:MAG: pirin family protein [Alphaproteobacteria bacterium]|nr:pirin family protein [Alphaproteobacteria bacterium]